ncbi:MAG TPA: hypothetical protein VFS21_24055 [Roseiflexaceae bacterium]|nr:hypothetical protein [Roseiflexaceae bacterium]
MTDDATKNLDPAEATDIPALAKHYKKLSSTTRRCSRNSSMASIGSIRCSRSGSFTLPPAWFLTVGRNHTDLMLTVAAGI